MASTALRTLLISPPSVASHPARLESLHAAHDRAATDIQMLDRLALGLVSLPATTYDRILILSDADDSRAESRRLIDRAVLGSLVKALRPGGRLESQDGSFASEKFAEEKREAILAGLVVDTTNSGASKPEASAAAVPLRRKREEASGSGKAVTMAAGTGAPGAPPVELNGGVTGSHINGSAAPSPAPAGVGFVDFSDDLDLPDENEDEDEELIDEDTLIDENDLARPIVQREHFPMATM